MFLWVYAWRGRQDVDLAIRIIQAILLSQISIPYEDIAAQANAALRGERELNRNSSEIEEEWGRIRKALIGIGVKAIQLDD